MNELKFAVRQLTKNPGFTAVAVITLALGIGANTAIFSVVDQLLVRPLPVAEPNRLALVAQAHPNGQPYFDFNFPLFRDYQRENKVFRQLSATAEMDVGLSTGGVTERRRAMAVYGNYFSMLGVPAAIGRTFAADEAVEIDDAAVLVLSHGLWVRQFGADPKIIGQSVTINGHPFTIIGVTPREFAGTSRVSQPELYLPITMYGQLAGALPDGENPLRSRYFTWLYILGRLNNGVTLPQAQASMTKLAQGIAQLTPANTATNLVVLPGTQGFTHELRETRLPLHLLLGASGLVLLIACANLANLQLARATARVRDFAIRLALGAGRRRLIRELLAESLLLALCGGGLGVLLAGWLVRFLGHFRPVEAALELSPQVDQRVLVFAFVASVTTGILFGLVPALRATRPDLLPELKIQGGAGQTRLGRWNLRNALVVVQIAVSLLVLVGAGLCIRSLRNLQKVDPGFEPSELALMSFDLGLNRYDPPRGREFYNELLERVRAFPGVEAAGLALNTPLSGRSPAMSVERLEDYQPGPREHAFADLNIVSPGYFGAMGIPLLQGRDFSSHDTENSAKVVIINEAFGERYWPGQNPLGKRLFQHGPNGGIATEVIGVVRTTNNRRLTDKPRQMFYFPLAQKSELALTLAVRSGVEAATTIHRVRDLVKSLDGQAPVFGVRTMSEQRDASLGLQRMAAVLLTGFGGLALLLAALGIYAVLAYSVRCRTREIGVRMALGAQLADVLNLVMRQGVRLALLGLGLGLAGALGASRLIRSFLFEVKPIDPTTFLGVTILLGAVALAACWLPARQAAKTDPMEALRHD